MAYENSIGQDWFLADVYYIPNSDNNAAVCNYDTPSS